MPTPAVNAQFDWATKRSRLGLLLGPGSVIAGFLTAFIARAVGLWSGEMIPAVGYAMIGLALIAFAQVCSFVEFLATVRVLRRRSAPVLVWALAGYWMAVLVVVACIALGAS